MATWVPVNAHSNQSQAQNFCTMKKWRRKRAVRWGRPLRYAIVSESPRMLRLMNGTKIKQPIEGVELYIAKGKHVYALTQFGLRERCVDFTKKNNYCKKIISGRGHHQGQAYPRVRLHGKKYPLHVLMALAWKGGIPKGKVADHINGDIDDFSYENIRVIDIPENDRCGGILRRMRNAAKRMNEPRLNPKNMPQEKLLEIFETLPIPKNGRVKDEVWLRYLD